MASPKSKQNGNDNEESTEDEHAYLTNDKDESISEEATQSSLGKKIECGNAIGYGSDDSRDSSLKSARGLESPKGGKLNTSPVTGITKRSQNRGELPGSQEKSARSPGSSHGKGTSPRSTNTAFKRVHPRRNLHEDEKREPIPASSLHQNPSKNNLETYWIVVIVISIVAIIWFFLSASEDTNSSCHQVSDQKLAVNTVYKNISQNLPEQSQSFWQTLKAQVRSRYRPNPKPSCITLAVVGPEADTLLTCINKHVECVLSGSSEVLVIDASQEMSSPQPKSEIDTQLNEHFKKGRRVAILRHIDRLKYFTAEILYRYCDDNDNSAYPDTMMFLTLSATSDDKITDYWLDHKLREAWTDDDDTLIPLLSRIGNNLIPLNATQSSGCSVK